MAKQTTVARRRPSRRTPLSPSVRRVLGVVAIGSAMALLDSTIVNVALRSLSTRLDASVGAVQWVVTGYLLALAAVIPIAGWTANRFGARRVYVAALALFTLGSLGAGLAHGIAGLIGCRVVQGIGGGLLSPVGQALLVTAAGRERMARVVSLLAVPNVLAPVFGPAIGGLLIDGPGWRWIFFVNVPIGVAGLVLALRLLPRTPARAVGRPDFVGLTLVCPALVGLTYGLAAAGRDGTLAAPGAWLPLLAGAVLLAGFVVRTLRTARPLLPLRLLRGPLFGTSVAGLLCVSAALFGGMILMPLYYQGVRGQSALATGLLMMPGGVGGAIASWAAGRLVDRLGSGVTALLGVVLGVAATVPFGLLTAHTSYVWLSVLLGVRGAGTGLMLMPVMVAAYRALPQGEANTTYTANMATPLLTVAQRVGASVGTALLATVLAAGLSDAAGGRAASAYANAFWWMVGTLVLAALPAVALTVAERRAASRADHP